MHLGQGKLKEIEEEQSCYIMMQEYVVFDPETGLFRWIVSGRCFQKGAIAGYKKKNSGIMITCNKIKVSGRRLAWFIIYGCIPTGYITHKDNDIFNLKKGNLCCFDSDKRRRKQSSSAKNQSHVSGIVYHRTRKYWSVYHTVKGSGRIYLGSPSTLCEAKAIKRAFLKKKGLLESFRMEGNII